MVGWWTVLLSVIGWVEVKTRSLEDPLSSGWWECICKCYEGVGLAIFVKRFEVWRLQSVCLICLTW